MVICKKHGWTILASALYRYHHLLGLDFQLSAFNYNFNYIFSIRLLFRAGQSLIPCLRKYLPVSGKLKPTYIMGFNIGVSSEQTPNTFDCHVFIDRAFYNFVNDGEQYGDESILIKVGQYYGLDLSPLLKLVYTWDEVTADYIKENVQAVDFLLTMTVAFRDKIQKDNSVCDKIEYVWYDQPINLSQADIDRLISEMGEEMARPFLGIFERKKKEIVDNPNPWKWYFEQGQIIEDLNNLIKNIKCYKDKGVTEIYLTAG